MVRLLLTESLLLSLTGGVLGIVVAEFSLPPLVALAPANLPQADQCELDDALLCGDAFRSDRGAVRIVPCSSVLAAGDRESLAYGKQPHGDAGCGAQRTESSSGGRSSDFAGAVDRGRAADSDVQEAEHVDPGFDARRVLVTQMSLTAEKFATTAATASLEDRVQSVWKRFRE